MKFRVPCSSSLRRRMRVRAGRLETLEKRQLLAADLGMELGSFCAAETLAVDAHYHPAAVDFPFGQYSSAEVERLEHIPFDSDLSTKTIVAQPDSSPGDDILTFVIDIKESFQPTTSDIFNNEITTFDFAGYGFAEADVPAISQSVLQSVREDFFDELIGTVAGPAGEDLEIDFILGDIGTAPVGLTEFYYVQVGTGTVGPHTGGTLGVAGGSVVRNSFGNGPNFNIQPGDVVASVFTDAINGLGGLSPNDALRSGNLGFTTNAIAGTLSHEIGHTLSLSHINKAGSLQPTGQPPIMGTGAIDLPNRDRIIDREFSLSGLDRQNNDAPRQHVQQLVDAVGLHKTAASAIELIGVDFGAAGVLGSPENWNAIQGVIDGGIYPNLFSQTGRRSPVGLNFSSDGTDPILSGTPISAATIPTHEVNLRAIDGAIAGGGTGEFQWFGLTPEVAYDVYVFGNGNQTEQQVRIIGVDESQEDQSLVAGDLWVNGELGDASRSLTSMAQTVTADANGTITVSVAANPGDIDGRWELAGLAIQQARGTIAGTKWYDLDADSVRDPDEPGLADVTIYVDINGNGRFDPSEPFTVTATDDPTTAEDETGRYLIENLPAGDAEIREVVPPGFYQTFPAIVAGVGNQIVNGGFETGDFENWVIEVPGSGQWNINDGTFTPRGTRTTPLPPLAGNFDAVTDQGGPGLNRIYQTITLPTEVFDAELSWIDRIENHPGQFSDPNQQFRVLIRDEFGGEIATVFETNPGDEAIQIGPNVRTVDIGQTLSALGGQTIQVVFEQEDNLGFFNATIDDVALVINEGLPQNQSSTPIADSATADNGFWLVNVTAGGRTFDVDFGNADLPPGSVEGLKWDDINGDGIINEGEPGLAGVQIFADLNDNGLFDDGEPFDITASDDPTTSGIDETGLYRIDDLPLGFHTIREIVPGGFSQTFPVVTPGAALDTPSAAVDAAGPFDRTTADAADEADRAGANRNDYLPYDQHAASLENDAIGREGHSERDHSEGDKDQDKDHEHEHDHDHDHDHEDGHNHDHDLNLDPDLTPDADHSHDDHHHEFFGEVLTVGYDQTVRTVNYLPPQYQITADFDTLAAKSTPAAGDDSDQTAAIDPLNLAIEYLRDNAAQIGLDVDDLNDFIVTDQYTTPHNGVTHLYLRQVYDGIEIIGADINVNVMPDGTVLSAGSSFIADAAPVAMNDYGPWFYQRLSPIDALGYLADHLHLPEDDQPILVAASDSRDASAVIDSQLSTDPIPARLRYIPTVDGLELSWNFTIYTTDGQHAYDASVTQQGELVHVHDWVSHATYEVFAAPIESPNFGSRSVVTDPDLLAPEASPFGWHDTDGAAGPELTITSGNNVNAYADRDGNNQPDPGSQVDGGPGLNFSSPLDLSAEPDVYQDAAVTNLFYWNNILHDVHYQYGFDEASGNFQVNNYGKGGNGGDPVLAEAQDNVDGGRRNNANMATPPDGFSPRMQMFLWNRSTPERDGDFDNGIIAHEYGHGVSNRLTGGPGNSGALSAAQSGGMGEGWSDFHGLMFTQRPEDTAVGSKGIGTYALNQPATGRGIRTLPYSYDMNVNDHTYGRIASGTLFPPHGYGEVWATTLWDLNWALIDGNSLDPALPNVGLGFDPDLYNGDGGNNLAMQLVMDGMKLQPANPSFLDARDAILAADFALTGGQYHDTMWTVFARRGMGFSADDGGSANSVDVTEAFDLPPTAEGMLDIIQETVRAGDDVEVRLVDGDLIGLGQINIDVVSDGGDTETITLVETLAGTFFGTLSTTERANSPFDGTLSLDGGDRFGIEFLDEDDGTGQSVLLTDFADALIQLPLFNADFSTLIGEPDLDGFTIDNSNNAQEGLWHLSIGRGEQPGHSATHSLYFGTGETRIGGGSYDVGSTRGRAISPVIDLGPYQNAALSFNSFLEAEDVGPFDTASVRVFTADGNFVEIASRQNGLNNNTDRWDEIELDLTPFVGQSIEVEFFFDTIDSAGNDFEGWYVDDVAITTDLDRPIGTGAYEVFVDAGLTTPEIHFGNQLGVASPAVVTGVLAGGSLWMPDFIDAVNDASPSGVTTLAENPFGYHLDADQVVPTGNIDRLFVQFDQPVTGFDASTVRLLGGSGFDYASAMTVRYDDVNDMGIIELPDPILNDRLRLVISDLVTGADGLAIDGDASGSAGGDHDFFFNILVGDASDDGSVNGGDIPTFSGAFNQSFGQAAYRSQADWNGDGSVNGGDLPFFSSNFNQSLPAAPPTTDVVAFGATSNNVAADTNTGDAADDLLPPIIEDIIVAGSTWTASFIDTVDDGGSMPNNALGMAVAEGQTLSVAGIDRVHVLFSEPIVGFDSFNVSLTGVNGIDDLGTVTIAYDEDNLIGTVAWTQAIGNDRLLFALANGLTDAAGNPLVAPPSMSILTDRFELPLDILEGDANGDGSVNGGDVIALSAAFGSMAGQSNYDAAADWDANGMIDIDDVMVLRRQFNQSLPASTPAAARFAASSEIIADEDDDDQIDEIRAVDAAFGDYDRLLND